MRNKSEALHTRRLEHRGGAGWNGLRLGMSEEKTKAEVFQDLHATVARQRQKDCDSLVTRACGHSRGHIQILNTPEKMLNHNGDQHEQYHEATAFQGGHTGIHPARAEYSPWDRITDHPRYRTLRPKRLTTSAQDRSGRMKLQTQKVMRSGRHPRSCPGARGLGGAAPVS